MASFFIPFITTFSNALKPPFIFLVEEWLAVLREA